MAIARVMAIAFGLLEFQAPRRAQHDELDAGETDQADDPIQKTGTGRDCRYPDTGLEQHFSEIIRATHQAEQADIAEGLGMGRLEGGLLSIGNGFNGEAKKHDGEAIGQGGYTGSRRLGRQSDLRGGIHGDIEGRHGEPDGQLQPTLDMETSLL